MVINNTCLLLGSPENLDELFNQFNNFLSDQRQNSYNIRNWKCYDFDKPSR